MAKKGFNLDNYRTVDTRLREFWLEHPNWSFTSICHVNTDEKVVFESTIKDENNNIRSNGWAEEHRELLRFVGSHNAVEVAETSARGRALSGLGYLGSTSAMPGSKIPGREEMEIAKAIEDKLSAVPIPKELEDDLNFLYEASKKKFPEIFNTMKSDEFWKRIQLKAIKEKKTIDSSWIKEKQNEIEGVKTEEVSK